MDESKVKGDVFLKVTEYIDPSQIVAGRNLIYSNGSAEVYHYAAEIRGTFIPGKGLPFSTQLSWTTQIQEGSCPPRMGARFIEFWPLTKC